MNRADPLPLRPMLVAIGIVGTAGLVSLCFYVEGFLERRERKLDRARESLARIAGDFGQDRKTLRIVTFGSSLLQAATHEEKDLEQIARERWQVELRFVRFGQAGGGIGAWHPVIRDLDPVCPEIVVFEDYYLFHRRWWVVHHLRGYRGMLISWTENLFGRGPSTRSEGNRGPRLLAGGAESIPHPFAAVDERRVRRRAEYRERALTFGLRPKARELFDQLQHSGIKIVVAEMPVSDLGRAARVPGRIESMTGELGRLEKEGRIILLRCPEVFTDEDFDDFLHIDHDARIRFSDWLLSELIVVGNL